MEYILPTIMVWHLFSCIFCFFIHQNKWWVTCFKAYCKLGPNIQNITNSHQISNPMKTTTQGLPFPSVRKALGNPPMSDGNRRTHPTLQLALEMALIRCKLCAKTALCLIWNGNILMRIQCKRGKSWLHVPFHFSCCLRDKNHAIPPQCSHVIYEDSQDKLFDLGLFGCLFNQNQSMSRFIGIMIWHCYLLVQPGTILKIKIVFNFNIRMGI